MYNELVTELNTRGVSFIKAVDISLLSEKENRGYNVAVIIGIALSPGYIFHQLCENIVDYSEFNEKEHRTDEVAEWVADFLISKGYRAFAQSERNLIDRYFNVNTKTTPLPHKKIAILAGLGWIGKNNLLVTQEFGSAICMCTVLTNAPLPIKNAPMIKPKCGKCTICKDICPAGVLHGTTWEPGMNRDLIVDVYHCDACLKCLLNCSWTKKYAINNVNLLNE
jgi:epoxyqueuosine reductase QueG